MLGYPEQLSDNVYEVAEWLQEEHRIIIYDSVAPFVHDPKTVGSKAQIIYAYSVKQCNIRDGWNGRYNVGRSHDNTNRIEAFKEALKLAIEHLEWLFRNKRVPKKYLDHVQ